MAKRVLIVASGETERVALPGLLRGLSAAGIELCGVRMPPRNGKVTPNTAHQIITAATNEAKASGQEIDKYVVLVDCDGKSVQEALEAIEPVKEKCGGLAVLTAACKWHLEAWFFADEQGLRKYVGGSLGNVNASDPDSIANPKLHLKHLLDDLYTSRIAERIAWAIDPAAVLKSPTFSAFEKAVRNGPQKPSTPT